MFSKRAKAKLIIATAIIAVAIAAFQISKSRTFQFFGENIPLHVMYQSRIESRKSVRGIISGLKREGYSFKTVSEMLAATDTLTRR